MNVQYLFLVKDVFLFAARVVLTFRGSGCLALTDTVHTGLNGSLSYVFTPRDVGVLSVNVSWPGNENYEGTLARARPTKTAIQVLGERTRKYDVTLETLEATKKLVDKTISAVESGKPPEAKPSAKCSSCWYKRYCPLF